MSVIELEDLFEVLEELKERARNGWVIVVEGEKDVASLRKLGVAGEILTFSGYSATADRVGKRKTIILTDYDERGREIERGLSKALLSYGNVADVEIKRKIFCKIKKEVTKVEELYGFVKKYIQS
ncbi:hypothetical protein B6U96_11285 [Archaeoglobales archaeon ex4484_92]|nr:MAG: hypothetical protein B6U96_11285 [Archaeoglobales archaeon ex4484_92]HDN74021.1 hypothetical protein [Archaeoglobus sp.]